MLLVNLGSPDSPSVPDVRRYLAEFLSDPLVIDIAGPLRALLLHGVILPFRPKRSAEAYAQIWTDEGSPLIVYSERLAEALRARLELPVALGMRYGRPTLDAAIDTLLGAGCDELLCVPLYPHYAMSSYETVARAVRERLGERALLRFLPPFFEDPGYLDALAGVSRPHLAADDDLLLISFHGIPERHVRKRDPSECYCLTLPDCCAVEHPARAMCYRAQCYATARGLAARLALPEERWAVSFQSRLGRRPWLRPYTDLLLEALPGQGVRKLTVVCPSFVSDCLETLEEICLRGKESFLAAGGERFTVIPCLNADPAWVEVLADRVRAAPGPAPTGRRFAEMG